MGIQDRRTEFACLNILNYLANGTIAQCRGVCVYGCKGWNHSYGTGRVVKTDYTDISSDSDVTAFQFLIAADSHLIVRENNCISIRIIIKQFADNLTTVFRIITVYDHIFGDRYDVSFHCSSVYIQTFQSIFICLSSGNKTDMLSVVMNNQMFDGISKTGSTVGL